MSMPVSQRAIQPHSDRASWRLLARGAWVVVTILVLSLDIAGIPIAFQQAHTVCPAATCNFQFTRAQINQLNALGLSLDFYATFVVCLESLTTLVYTTLGVIIFWRRSTDGTALLGAFMLVTFGGAAFNGTMAALPLANPAWTFPTMLLNVTGQVAFYVFFCIFPSGHFVPRWTLWATLAWTATWLVQLFPQSPLASVGRLLNNGIAFIAVIALLIVAQIYRYRHTSSLTERQQTKWVVFGFVAGVGGFLAILLIGNTLLSASQRDNVQGLLISNLLVYLFLLLIPVAIALAILRSRLWEIDILINRTLVYGTLTALLVAVYATLTIGLEHAAAAVSGKAANQPIFIVIATLTIATLFHPLRIRIQSTIDRRFYRRKYDAAKTLDTFSNALRQQTDLHDLTDELLAVVDETMQPAHVSLWLRLTTPTRPSETGAGATHRDT